SPSPEAFHTPLIIPLPPPPPPPLPLAPAARKTQEASIQIFDATTDSEVILRPSEVTVLGRALKHQKGLAVRSGSSDDSRLSVGRTTQAFSVAMIPAAPSANRGGIAGQEMLVIKAVIVIPE
ncbi:Hypothetical predicted protein, partial [Podarcis lilfordi]